MSVFNRGARKSFKAGADLSSNQYHIVKLSAGLVVLAAAATDDAIGILMNAPKSGDVADVMLLNAGGTVKCIAGAAVAVGARLVANASGRAITGTQAIAGAQPTSRLVGMAITAAAANGDTIEMMLENYLF